MFAARSKSTRYKENTGELSRKYLQAMAQEKTDNEIAEQEVKNKISECCI